MRISGLMNVLISSVGKLHLSIRRDRRISSSAMFSSWFCQKFLQSVALAVRKDTSLPKLSRNAWKTFFGSAFSSSDNLNLFHLLRPSSPNIRTIFVYCSFGSTLSPANHSLAFAWKVSHVQI